jgi:hypothetical protein
MNATYDTHKEITNSYEMQIGGPKGKAVAERPSICRACTYVKLDFRQRECEE